MKCVICKTELVCKWYQKRKSGYTNQRERALFECPNCGHKERF